MFTKGVTSSLIALISPTRKAARSVNHLMEQLMLSIQSIWLANCKESSKLVVLTNNYSPDYAPFTVDKKGTLEKVPVQIRVGFQILRVFPKIFFFRLTWSRFWISMKLIKYLATNSASTWPGDEVFISQMNIWWITIYQNDELVNKKSKVRFSFETAQHEGEH